jgi:hypothetical protein
MKANFSKATKKNAETLSRVAGSFYTSLVKQEAEELMSNEDTIINRHEQEIVQHCSNGYNMFCFVGNYVSLVFLYDGQEQNVLTTVRHDKLASFAQKYSRREEYICFYNL